MPGAERRLLLRPAGLIALVTGAALAVSGATGSLVIPHDDSWSYIKVATQFWHTGQFHLQGFGQMFLLGQIVTAVPLMAVFGARPLALNIYGALAGALFLGCSYALARSAVGHRRALFVVAGLSVFPGFGLLSATFMTDLPSAGTALLCLTLGLRAIRRRSPWWWVACLLAGFWAFTIREQTIAALVAVTVACVSTPSLRRRFKVAAAGSTVAVLAVSAVLDHIRHQMANADVPPFGLSTLHLDRLPPSLLPMLFDCGLFLLPLAVWSLATLRPRQLRSPARIVGWVVAIAAVAVVLVQHHHLTVGNYFDPNGSYLGAVVGQGHPTFGPAVWAVLQTAAGVGGVIIAGELAVALTAVAQRGRRFTTGDPLVTALSVFAVLTALGMVFLAFAGEVQRDRYLIPVLLPLAILLVRRPFPVLRWRRPAIAGCAALLACVGLVSWGMTLSADVRDKARWSAAQDLVDAGVPATHINAGIEWDGTHSPVPADKLHRLAIHFRRKFLYLGAIWPATFPQTVDCWLVSTSPLEAKRIRLVRKTTMQPYGLSLGTARIYVYQRPRCRGAINSVPESLTGLGGKVR